MEEVGNHRPTLFVSEVSLTLPSSCCETSWVASWEALPTQHHLPGLVNDSHGGLQHLAAKACHLESSSGFWQLLFGSAHVLGALPWASGFFPPSVHVRVDLTVVTSSVFTVCRVY